MRTIGMLGGMSWESTAIYYRLANELVRERLGGLHSARIQRHRRFGAEHVLGAADHAAVRSGV